MAFPTTGILSSFTGADESPISEGGNWTNDPFSSGYQPLQRVSNALSGTAAADNEAGWGVSSFGPDSEVYVTLATKAADGFWLWLGLRGDFATEDGYFLAWITASGTDTQRIYRKDSGVNTQLGATNSAEFASSDDLGFEAVGDTLTAYQNGSSLFSRTDSTHGGSGKLFVYADNTGVRMDDFGGGTVVQALTYEPDVMQRNPMTYSGNVSLIDSMLVRDADPAVHFQAGSSFTVPHSASLNLLNGAVGGIAIAFPLRIAAYPASDTLLFNKSGEYAAQILTDGTLRFLLTGGQIDSSAPIPLDTDVFVTLVYNGAYAGTPIVGNSTPGGSFTNIGADYRAGTTTSDNNLNACRFQILERGQIYQIQLNLERYSGNPAFQDVAAAIFSDSAAAPDAVLGQAAGQYLGSLALGTQPSAWVTFPLPEPFELDVNEHLWIAVAGGADHTSETPVMMIGSAASGGTRKYKHMTVSDSSAGPANTALSAFGAAAGSDSVLLDMYADYTPLGRTGDEGNLLIYLDGQEDSRSAYTGGITAGTDDLTGPEMACDMDELLLWNRKLGPVEVAQLFAAR